MSARSVYVIVWVAAMPVAMVGAGETSAPATQERSLAVAGLLHSARSAAHSDAASTRAGIERVRVLLECAERLDPGNVPVNRQLLSYYRDLGRLSKNVVNLDHARQAGRRYLAAHPDDLAVGAMWIAWSLAGQDQAEQRIQLLDGIVGDAKLAKAIRSMAAAQLCGIYLRQSDRDRSKASFALAMELDAYGPQTASLAANFDEDLSKAAQLERALGFLRGNPRGMREAWAVGRMLQGAGLYDRALPHYRLAHDLAAAKPVDDGTYRLLLVDYLNALLDVGKAAEAVKVAEPEISRFADDLALRGLMVEARRSLGDKAKADVDLHVMDRVYAPLRLTGAARSAGQAAELGWYHLVYDPKPAEALSWAREAFAKAPKDPFVLRVLGMAELATKAGQAGAANLEAIATKDAHAAAALAEHLADAGDRAGAVKVLKMAAEGVRTGTGWRSVARVAKAKGIQLPPAADAAAMVRLLDAQPAAVLGMAANPEKYVRVRLTSARRQVAPGEPIEVTLEVANLSDQPVPLGQWGLIEPVAFLSVEIAGRSRKQFPNLSSVALPAPRYLAAGQSVKLTVRMDIGPVEQFLTDRPLEAFDLTIQAVVDPIQVGGKLRSATPQLKVSALQVRRTALFDRSGGEAAAKRALGLIVRDLRRGDLATKIAAARKTASLLCHARKAEMGKATAVFPRVLTKGIALSLTRAFLQADDPVVRAEMLAALHLVDLDSRIISLTAPCVADSDPLVRFRLIELLAAKGTPGRRPLLKMFARDDDEMVRRMATVLTRE